MPFSTRPSVRISTTAIFVGLLTASMCWAQVSVSEEPDLEAAYDLFSIGESAQAIVMLEQLLADVEEPVERSHLVYLIGRAEQQAGDCDAAIAHFFALEEAAEPDDPWVSRARFGRAACLLESGETLAALEVFSDEAESLISGERRTTLAEEVAVYAREALDGGGDEAAIDEPAALELYRVIRDLEPGGDLQNEADHHVAALSGDTWELQDRIRRDPLGTWACADRLALGRLNRDSRLLSDVAQRCDADQAIEAALFLDDTFGGWLAVSTLQDTNTRFPTHERAVELSARLALRLVELDTETSAWSAVRAAIVTPDGIDIDLALQLASGLADRGWGESARTLWEEIRGATNRVTVLDQISREWRLTRYREMAAFVRDDQLDDALVILELLADEMVSEQAETHLLSGRLLAVEERWEEALTQLEEAGTIEGQRIRIEILEAFGDLEAALPLRDELGVQYRSEELEVVVPHDFTSHELAHLLARTDGLEEVELRLHHVDVEDFMMSMATMQGLEDLDVDLIAPDETRTVDLGAPLHEAYQRAGPTNGPIELGELSPGVYTVHVLGETQQATTVVRVTDLSLVARSVGGDLAVLVLDRTSGHPMPGARVIVADGSRILEDGVTGSDGVFRAEVDPGQLEILATLNEHVTWTSLNDAGISASEERTRLGERREIWATLDRGQAAPGETVSFVAFLSEGDAPAHYPTEDIEVSLRSGSEVLVAETLTVVRGVVEGDFTLPADMPAGTYHVNINEERSLSFRVDRPGAYGPEIRLSQTTPVGPGGTAEVVAQLWGPSGRPVVGHALEGDLGDGQGTRLLGRTDGDGQLTLFVPVEAALQPPVIVVEDVRHIVETTNERGELFIQMPRQRPLSETSTELRWDGGTDAAVFVRIDQTGGRFQPDAPPLSPDWWPVFSYDLPNMSVFHQQFHLVEGLGTLSLPALSSGDYRIELEAVRSDGESIRWGRDFVIREEGTDLEILTPAQPADLHVEREVEYMSDVSLQIRCPGLDPMLLTLEDTGIVEHFVVSTGDTLTISLPDTVADSARIFLSRVDFDPDQSPAEVLRLAIPRPLDIEATVTPTPDPTVDIQVSRGGLPAEAPVLVWLHPSSAHHPPTQSMLLSSNARDLTADSGWSRGWRAVGDTTEIDSEILAWQAEIRYRNTEATVIDLGQVAQFPDDLNWDEGGYGLGYSESWSGGSGYGSMGGDFGMGNVVSRGHIGIDPRHEPALWILTRTDAAGRLVVDVPEAAIQTGWYSLTVVSLEGVGEPEPTSSTEPFGAVYSEAVWLDGEGPHVAEEAVALGSTWDHRSILESGEGLDVDFHSAQWVRVEVSESSIAGLIATLLGPDAIPAQQPHYWREQMETFDLLATFEDEEENALPLLRRYIAEHYSQSSAWSPQLGFQTVAACLDVIEVAGEDEVELRAEALLGLGRVSPGHGQGSAAVLRLLRDPAALEANVVGTVALAAMSLTDDGMERARDLIPEIEAAVAHGSLLGRARALEALARLEHPLPVDPESLLSEIPALGDDRADIDVAAVIGSSLRALLSDETSGWGGDSELAITGIQGGATTLGPGEYMFRVDSTAPHLSLEATAGPVAVRVMLIDEDVSPTEPRIVRTAQRHGVWFRGIDVLPPSVDEIEPADTSVVDRRLRVRLTIPAMSEPTEVQIEELLPPGVQLVAGSVVGLRLIEHDERRLILRGTIEEEHVVTYEVDVLFPTQLSGISGELLVDEHWSPTLMRSETGHVLASADPCQFMSYAPDRELSARLVGDVVWPTETSDLSTPERLDLGVALQLASEGDEVLLRQSLDTLLAILYSGELDNEQVARGGQAAFRSAISLDDDEAFRELFSLLEVRAPQAPITQDELIQVVRAFRRDGDVEYGLRAWQALLNLRFLAEVGAGQQLFSIGQEPQGLALIHDITRSYPDIPSVVESIFSLPQLLSRQAEYQPDTPEGRFNARRYFRTADRWLAEFLTRYGADDTAHEAALAHLHVLVELEDWDRLLLLGSGYMSRFESSELLDSFIFLTAYGHQRAGEHPEAQALYGRIVEEEFSGQPSSDRDRARLALAQIEHAQGNLEAALEGYREVRHLFPDAEAMVRVLESAELRVPEVVQGLPGEGIELPLRSRGVEHVQMWAYQVDLERLFLREKQVRAVSDISLAGIEPALEAEIDVPIGYGSLVDHQVELALYDPGAYLVLLRSDTALTSSLVIVSDIHLDIVQDPYSYVLHVAVLDSDGAPIDGATVRFSDRYADTTDSETTDLRGLVHLTGRGAETHILARVDDSYAVYRGGEIDRFAMPSEIDTGWGYAEVPIDWMLEGQLNRNALIQEDNLYIYDAQVFGNRRDTSNFELW